MPAIVFVEETTVELVRNKTYHCCLKFVSEHNGNAELKSAMYGYFIRNCCSLHVFNKSASRTLSAKAFVLTSTLFDILEDTIRTDLADILEDTIRTDLAAKSVVANNKKMEDSFASVANKKKEACIKKKFFIPCTRQTRRACAKTSAYIQNSTRTKDLICYNNGCRHVPGDRPKMKPIRTTSISFPTVESSVFKKRIGIFSELVSFHSLLKRNGIVAPRDNWEDWVNNCEEEQCDRAFMCLMVILMSSSTSDRQLGDLVPLLFAAGMTSAVGVIDIVQKYGVDCFCALLSGTGRYYQNAERIINAADYFAKTYHDGRVPRNISVEELSCLHGVGYKTANIVVTTAFHRMDGIPTDVHVLRWAKLLGWWTHGSDGFLCSKSIESWLPSEWWPFVNPVFGSFGQLLSFDRKRVLGLVTKYSSNTIRAIFVQACNHYYRK